MQEHIDEFTESPPAPSDDVPLPEPVSDKEMERRKEIVKRMIRRADQAGPMGVHADDLLHIARAEQVR
jgi:hypothetical protein